MRASLNHAETQAAQVGAHMVMIGILPTLSAGHMSPASLTPNPRYQLLSDQILAARGEDIVIDIVGPEHLRTTADSIVPEAACTSTQLHIQVSPEDFPAYWNASQAIAGVQLALGANSPFLLGRELWQETRVPLFEQATDTRSEELKAQGVRPRVWFGERWINSIFDLFEENVRYFPALLPVIEDEDPLDELESGRTPSLAELRLHNGTIYRWNRPVYDVVDGRPAPARREPRPARRPDRRRHDGERRASTSAWSGRWPSTSGRCGPRCRSAPPRRTSTSRPGRASRPRCTGRASARCPATELVVRRLLPLARAGLDSWGVTPEESERLLGIIEQRCIVGQNGASWFAARFGTRLAENDGDRLDALRTTLNEYRERMHTNEPVHTWE